MMTVRAPGGTFRAALVAADQPLVFREELGGFVPGEGEREPVLKNLDGCPPRRDAQA
jgi:hypothetical protein